MRLILAALIPIVLFGGVASYVEFTERLRPTPIDFETQPDDSHWAVRLYTTADLEGDVDFDEPSLTVRFRGKRVLADFESVQAGKVIQIDPLEGVQSGQNSLFVHVNFSSNKESDGNATTQPAAIRVQVFRGDQLLSERTFWKPDGRRSISGEIKFTAPTSSTVNEGHRDGDLH